VAELLEDDDPDAEPTFIAKTVSVMVMVLWHMYILMLRVSISTLELALREGLFTFIRKVVVFMDKVLPNMYKLWSLLLLVEETFSVITLADSMLSEFNVNVSTGGNFFPFCVKSFVIMLILFPVINLFRLQGPALHPFHFTFFSL